MNTCVDSFKKKSSILAKQAFLSSNNIITNLEKNLEREINIEKTVCNKLKLSVNQLPKNNLSKSHNVSDMEIKFNYVNDNTEKNSKKDNNHKNHNNRKRFKV